MHDFWILHFLFVHLYDLLARWRRPDGSWLVFLSDAGLEGDLLLFLFVVEHCRLTLGGDLLYHHGPLLLQSTNLLFQILDFCVEFYFELVEPVHGLVFFFLVLLLLLEFLQPGLQILHLLVNALQSLRHLFLNALPYFFHVLLYQVKLEGADARLSQRLIRLTRGLRRRALGTRPSPYHLNHLILEFPELLREHFAHSVELFPIYELALRKANPVINELADGTLVHEVARDLIVQLLDLLL